MTGWLQGPPAVESVAADPDGNTSRFREFPNNHVARLTRAFDSLRFCCATHSISFFFAHKFCNRKDCSVPFLLRFLNGNWERSALHCSLSCEQCRALLCHAPTRRREEEDWSTVGFTLSMRKRLERWSKWLSRDAGTENGVFCRSTSRATPCEQVRYFQRYFFTAKGSVRASRRQTLQRGLFPILGAPSTWALERARATLPPHVDLRTQVGGCCSLIREL